MKYYIGVDLGGTNIACGIVSEDGELAAVHSVPTGAGRAQEELIADMVSASKSALFKSGIDESEIAGLGVGVPGMVRDDEGLVIGAVNLGWKNVLLSSPLQKAFGVPVHLGNDADCAALGEVIAGSGSAYQSALMITIGTGIGGGLIRNKQVFTGWTGQGTEPGHFPLIFGGEPCACGSRGCFERYTAAPALVRQTQAAMRENPGSALWAVAGSLDEVTPKTSFDAALLGDETALALLDRYEEYLAAGIGGMVNILRPEVIIVGGGVSRQGEVLIAPVREKLRKYCYASSVIEPPAIMAASLGNDAGIIGAALLAK